MRLLVIFLAISLFLHIFAIIFAPGFNVMAAKPIEVIPITVEVREKEIKKIIPVSGLKNDKRNKIDDSKKSDAKKTDKNDKPNTPPPALPAKQTDETMDFTAPTVDPALLAAVESDIVANMNKMLDNNTSNKVKTDDSYVSQFLQDQLAQTNRNDNKPTNNTSAEVGKEITAARGNIDSNFLNFDVYPANNRSVTYAPPKPQFALPNDTSIKVRFRVDKDGNVYDIILVTRNIPQVEKIAMDYVKNLKFAANGNTDTAQITLTFKVRGK